MRRVSISLLVLVAVAVVVAPRAGARTAPRNAEAATPAGAPVVVAVIDSGVDANLPSLAPQIVPGWNFVGGTSDTTDDNGHGTAVTSIIASAEQTSGIPGACTQCRILPVKVLGADETGSWDTVAAGIVWAADHDADVINLSLGSPRVPDSIAGAVSYALSKGVIVVAAAGNDGRNESFYPADFAGVVSVAGVDPGQARYPWSNFGGNVTVAAPGCAGTPWLGGGFNPSFCGTSAAAPFVTGLAALAVSYRPTLTPGDFAAALAASGDPLPDPATAVDGLANVQRLLTAIGVPAAPPSAAVQPRLKRVPVVGRAIAAVPGSWRNASSLSFQWQRSRDGAGWKEIGSGAAYTPSAADRGYRLRLVVSAVNPRGRTTATSAPSARVEFRRALGRG